jgi:hypothetical protein
VSGVTIDRNDWIVFALPLLQLVSMSLKDNLVLSDLCIGLPSTHCKILCNVEIILADSFFMKD